MIKPNTRGFRTSGVRRESQKVDLRLKEILLNCDIGDVFLNALWTWFRGIKRRK